MAICVRYDKCCHELAKKKLELKQPQQSIRAKTRSSKRRVWRRTSLSS